jgi:hypothetical protein
MNNIKKTVRSFSKGIIKEVLREELELIKKEALKEVKNRIFY